jgi:hypothetical protein
LFFGKKGPPPSAQEALRSRLGAVVPTDVLSGLVRALQAKAGDTWAKVEPDKLIS